MIMNTMLTITNVAILHDKNESFKQEFECQKQGKTTHTESLNYTMKQNNTEGPMNQPTNSLIEIYELY